jgi:hypothetical protein
MTTVTLFKNSNGNVNVALKSGNTVAFILGRFFTTNAKLQAELQEAADNSQEFGIYVDIAEPEIDPECATPLDQLRKRVREEVMAELKAGGRLVDAGVSHQTLTQQSISSSASVAGQAELTEGQRKLAEDQTKVVEEGSNSPTPTVVVDSQTAGAVDTRTPQQIALDKLKAGNTN